MFYKLQRTRLHFLIWTFYLLTAKFSVFTFITITGLSIQGFYYMFSIYLALFSPVFLNLFYLFFVCLSNFSVFFHFILITPKISICILFCKVLIKISILPTTVLNKMRTLESFHSSQSLPILHIFDQYFPCIF